MQKKTPNRKTTSTDYPEFFGTTFDAEHTLYLVLGTDDGQLYRWLSERALPRGSRVMLIEREDVIDQIVPNLPTGESRSRVTIVPFSEWLVEFHSSALDSYCFAGEIVVIRSPSAKEREAHEYEPLAASIEHDVATLINGTLMNIGRKQFIDEQLRNAADNIYPAEFIKGTLKGRTAVVLGGGPSLDEFLDWVQDNRRRLVVIAVSRIARQLKTRGLTPDIFVAIDPQALCFDTSKEMLEMSQRSIFVHADHSAHVLHAQWPGMAFFTGSQFPWTDPDNTPNLPVQGPTVTNQALALAVYLGCTNIVLVGVDLCFDHKGFTHSSGSLDRLRGPRLSSTGKPVLTNGGWYAETELQLALAIESMSTSALQATERGCRVVNPAKGAAAVDHVEHIDVTELSLVDDDVDAFRELTATLPESYDSNADREDRLNATASEVSDKLKDFMKVRRMIENARRRAKASFSTQNTRKNAKVFSQLNSLEETIDKDFPQLARLIKTYAILELSQLPNPDTETEWSAAQFQDWILHYYQIFLDTIDILIESLEHSTAQINKRLAEVRPPCDVHQLTKDWIAEGIPGRALVWRSKNEGSAQATDGALDESIESYRKLVIDRENERINYLKDQARTSFVRVIDSAKSAFLGNDMPGLRRTEKLLEANNELQLADFVRGLQHEKSEEIAQALEVYTKVVNYIIDDQQQQNSSFASYPLLRPTLERIVTIQLRQKDIAAVEVTLQILSEIESTWLPQYAEILFLNGKVGESIATVQQWLAQDPDNVAAFVLIAKIMKSVGQTEAMNWACQKGLSIQPDNEALRQFRNE